MNITERARHHLDRAAQVADEMDAALARAGRLENGDDMDGMLDRDVVCTLGLAARTHAELARAYVVYTESAARFSDLDLQNWNDPWEGQDPIEQGGQ